MIDVTTYRRHIYPSDALAGSKGRMDNSFLTETDSITTLDVPPPVQVQCRRTLEEHHLVVFVHIPLVYFP
jgi:hypothetical protein